MAFLMVVQCQATLAIFIKKINCLHNWLIMQTETKLFSFDS